MNYRLATFDDFERITALHVANWRETYRGAMLDHYLDHEVWDERHENWKRLLGDPADNQFVLLAEDGEKFCGFVCAYGNHHPSYGTLVENLHSDKSVRGHGVGKMLLARAADWSLASHPTAGLYLDVLESNTAAQGFYTALGGVHVESKPWVPPGGGEVIEFSYYWQDPRELVDKTIN